MIIGDGVMGQHFDTEQKSRHFVIMPPGTIVWEGLMFCNSFYFFSARDFRGPSADRAMVRSLFNFIIPVQKFGRLHPDTSPKKLGAKRKLHLVRFGTTIYFDLEYLREK